MIQKKEYLDELKKLNISTTLFNKFLKAYEEYESIQLGGTSNSATFIDEILEDLFCTKFSNDIYIPLTFISSPIGNVLFSIKFSSRSSNIFSPSEISIIANRATSLISIDIKNNKLIATKLGTSTYVINENDLIQYMLSKGFSLNIIHTRISNFLALKSKNFSLKVIKEKLSQDD